MRTNKTDDTTTGPQTYSERRLLEIAESIDSIKFTVNLFAGIAVVAVLVLIAIVVAQG